MSLVIFLSQLDEDFPTAVSKTVFDIFVIRHEGTDLSADPEDGDRVEAVDVEVVWVKYLLQWPRCLHLCMY